MKEVSIIIPVYKSPYIGLCLDSLFSQSYKNFEILCIGDKVEDDSHAIVKGYVERYPRKIQFYLQNGRGRARAANFGLSLAQGEYIMFVDADDFVEHDIIQKLLTVMYETEADLVCCGFDRVSPSGHIFSKEMLNCKQTYFRVTPENVTSLAFISPAPWAKLYKRTVIGNVRFPEGPIATHEDCIFFLSLIPYIKYIYILPQALYHYMVHESSGIANSNLEMSLLFRKYFQNLKRQFEIQGIFDEYKSLFELVVFIHIGIAEVHRMAKHPDIQLSKFIFETKNFLDINFLGWRYLSYHQNGKISFRSIALYVLKWLYLCNSFIIFIRIYNLIIKKLCIDIKW